MLLDGIGQTFDRRFAQCMIQVSGNRVRAARFPSFAKEGWLRHKKMAPFLSWRRRGSCFKPPLIKIVRDE